MVVGQHLMDLFSGCGDIVNYRSVFTLRRKRGLAAMITGSRL